MIAEMTNPRWSSDVSVDVTWDHPELSERLGPLPYTVIDNSGEPFMQEVWDGLMRGDYGPIAPLEG